MMLGKRPRPPMKRTTSMTEITVDVNNIEAPPSPSDTQHPKERRKPATAPPPMTFSPRAHRRSSGEFIETATFLRACGLCNRSLGPGKDIYMYRGDTAYCSLECRHQQIKQDERKEKCSFASMKKDPPPTGGSEASSNDQTVAATS
eukprot:TRINITY_DN22410_c0_g1_i1.p1 TRINITY_DN22410_c0_g1~~TRINITY_DN22410_c0_g1_i1.p1  ORF type:complete len:146 (-),score=7.86 TRINITY_DN22410_c0_g1_i1:203-640(-)